MPGRPLVIMLCGNVSEPWRSRYGDYDQRFLTGMAWPQTEARVVAVHHDQEPAPPEAYCGAVISGALAMVTERLPWSERAGRWLVRATAAGLPILAICYGHQLLAQAHGGEVGPGAQGCEYGTVPLTTTAAARHDPLFQALPVAPVVQEQHVQAVLTLPSSAVLLATSPRDPHHAFRLGACAWGVQFHPESDRQTVWASIDAQRTRLTAEGQDPDALQRASHESAHGRLLLRRFAALCRSPNLS